jgi:uncharacterized OsmC-like protein
MSSYEAVVATADDGTTDAAGPLTVQFRNARTGQRQQLSIDEFTGGHLLHLAVAGCVHNDLFREALARGIRLTHVEVRADGGFAGEPCESTGVAYAVDLRGDASQRELEDLVAHVERIAEVPSALRLGGQVTLTSLRVRSDSEQRP